MERMRKAHTGLRGTKLNKDEWEGTLGQVQCAHE